MWRLFDENKFVQKVARYLKAAYLWPIINEQRIKHYPIIIDKLFYFPNKKTLCWIAGYSADTKTSSVETIIKSLSENAKKFADVAKVDISKVQTALIEKSSRYKYMRVFYAVVEPENAPKEAYVFQNPDWSMWKWINDQT